MKFEVLEKGDVTLMNIGGRITLGSGDIKMRDKLLEQLDKGKKKIVLDLGEVSFIDSAGLGELVAAYTSARRHGAQVKLANLTKKIDDLLDITRLSSVFETFDSADDAVKSF
ncbi:MAG TPA: STAS domain-containing protein [Acidobacteriota bacterium]|jgi:anti-sigma B factor antagonist|nr:STAS domain-containing protein [Acidobacteriota bacterium]HNT17081.1 STAS domain-containing protein [Acidobacteriota bacterium]HPA26093.1 STAS domain-containing protein [Acidobacteriota bacterium]HQO19274.1 STAS domain-containing protein [Acidobacteriota bacterium]HQQ46086.1 STAS domain-containing protein [Acidobacteriota bacterium]